MPKGNTYTLEDIERGLLALAVNAGKATQAAKQAGIPEATLRYWRDEPYADRYEQIREQASQGIAKRIAAEAEAFILEASALEHRLLQDLEAKRGQLDPKDLAGALRNVTTSKALNQDKIASPLRGRPTIIEHRHTADESLTRLAKLGVIDLEDTDIIEEHTPQLDAGETA